MLEFAAALVTLVTDEELDCRMLGFADRPDGDGACLVLGRSLSFDDQDHGLGMHTYCLVDDVQQTAYGGVASWVIDDGVVVIWLDEHAAAAMGVSGYRISIDDPTLLETARRGLEELVDARS